MCSGQLSLSTGLNIKDSYQGYATVMQVVPTTMHSVYPSGFEDSYFPVWASLVAQWYRTCLPMQDTWVQSLVRKDLLEKEMATHSSIL